jgi:hypothetical protein
MRKKSCASLPAKLEKLIHFSYLIRSDAEYEVSIKKKHEWDTEEDLCRSNAVKIGYLRQLGKVLDLSQNYMFDYNKDKSKFGVKIDDKYLKPHGMNVAEFTKLMEAVVKAFRCRQKDINYDTYDSLWHLFVSFFKSMCGGELVKSSKSRIQTNNSRNVFVEYVLDTNSVENHLQLFNYRRA